VCILNVCVYVLLKGMWSVWDSLVDAVFALDMLLNFFTAVRSEDGIIITNKVCIYPYCMYDNYIHIP
jgi:hypothetical protein